MNCASSDWLDRVHCLDSPLRADMSVRALGLLLGFAALLRFARACPPACVCFSTSATGYRVDCTEQRLTEVPADIPANVTYLYGFANRLIACRIRARLVGTCI